MSVPSQARSQNPGEPDFNTLDEPIRETIVSTHFNKIRRWPRGCERNLTVGLLQLRDLRAVGSKFYHVLIPREKKSLLKECKYSFSVLSFHPQGMTLFGDYLLYTIPFCRGPMGTTHVMYINGNVSFYWDKLLSQLSVTIKLINPLWCFQDFARVIRRKFKWWRSRICRSFCHSMDWFYDCNT